MHTSPWCFCIYIYIFFATSCHLPLVYTVQRMCFFVYAEHVYCVPAYQLIPTLVRSNMYVHLKFQQPIT